MQKCIPVPGCQLLDSTTALFMVLYCKIKIVLYFVFYVHIVCVKSIIHPLLQKDMWGPAACSSKPSKQTRSVARKVGFISGAGKSGVGRVADICLKADSSRCLPFQTGGESFYRQSGSGLPLAHLCAETAQSSSNWLSMV